MSECKVTSLDILRRVSRGSIRPRDRDCHERCDAKPGSSFFQIKKREDEINAIFFSGSVNSFYCSVTLISAIDGKEAVCEELIFYYGGNEFAL